MKKPLLISVVALTLYLGQPQFIAAQPQSSTRDEAARMLRRFKPPNSKRYAYKIVLPPKPEKLPTNFRFDLVYKIGHYDFEYVAVRLERKAIGPVVDATYFSYGSALQFWKPYAKADSYIAKSGQLPAKIVDELFALAVTLYRSDIEKTYIPTRAELRRLRKGGLLGTTLSWSGSSSDGSIVLRLTDMTTGDQPILSATGTLHGGSSGGTMVNGYDDLRVHLFWKVFYDYLQTVNSLTDMDPAVAEKIALARLGEVPLAHDYHDYYRQALFVKTLGQVGTETCIPFLKTVGSISGLEKNWAGYLDQDASHAIKRITERYASLTR